MPPGKKKMTKSLNKSQRKREKKLEEKIKKEKEYSLKHVGKSKEMDDAKGFAPTSADRRMEDAPVFKSRFKLSELTFRTREDVENDFIKDFGTDKQKKALEKKQGSKPGFFSRLGKTIFGTNSTEMSTYRKAGFSRTQARRMRIDAAAARWGYNDKIYQNQQQEAKDYEEYKKKRDMYVARQKAKASIEDAPEARYQYETEDRKYTSESDIKIEQNPGAANQQQKARIGKSRNFAREDNEMSFSRPKLSLDANDDVEGGVVGAGIGEKRRKKERIEAGQARVKRAREALGIDKKYEKRLKNHKTKDDLKAENRKGFNEDSMDNNETLIPKAKLLSDARKELGNKAKDSNDIESAEGMRLSLGEGEEDEVQVLDGVGTRRRKNEITAAKEKAERNAIAQIEGQARVEKVSEALGVGEFGKSGDELDTQLQAFNAIENERGITTDDISDKGKAPKRKLDAYKEELFGDKLKIKDAEDINSTEGMRLSLDGDDIAVKDGVGQKRRQNELQKQQEQKDAEDQRRLRQERINKVWEKREHAKFMKVINGFYENDDPEAFHNDLTKKYRNANVDTDLDPIARPELEKEDKSTIGTKRRQKEIVAAKEKARRNAIAQVEGQARVKKVSEALGVGGFNEKNDELVDNLIQANQKIVNKENLTTDDLKDKGMVPKHKLLADQKKVFGEKSKEAEDIAGKEGMHMSLGENGIDIQDGVGQNRRNKEIEEESHALEKQRNIVELAEQAKNDNLEKSDMGTGQLTEGLNLNENEKQAVNNKDIEALGRVLTAQINKLISFDLSKALESDESLVNFLPSYYEVSRIDEAVFLAIAENETSYGDPKVLQMIERYRTWAKNFFNPTADYISERLAIIGNEMYKQQNFKKASAYAERVGKELIELYANKDKSARDNYLYEWMRVAIGPHGEGRNAFLLIKSIKKAENKGKKLKHRFEVLEKWRAMLAKRDEKAENDPKPPKIIVQEINNMDPPPENEKEDDNEHIDPEQILQNFEDNKKEVEKLENIVNGKPPEKNPENKPPENNNPENKGPENKPPENKGPEKKEEPPVKKGAPKKIPVVKNEREVPVKKEPEKEVKPPENKPPVKKIEEPVKKEEKKNEPPVKKEPEKEVKPPVKKIEEPVKKIEKKEESPVKKVENNPEKKPPVNQGPEKKEEPVKKEENKNEAPVIKGGKPPEKKEDNILNNPPEKIVDNKNEEDDINKQMHDIEDEIDANGGKYEYEEKQEDWEKDLENEDIYHEKEDDEMLNEIYGAGYEEKKKSVTSIFEDSKLLITGAFKKKEKNVLAGNYGDFFASVEVFALRMITNQKNEKEMHDFIVNSRKSNPNITAVEITKQFWEMFVYEFMLPLLYDLTMEEQGDEDTKADKIAEALTVRLAGGKSQMFDRMKGKVCAITGLKN